MSDNSGRREAARSRVRLHRLASEGRFREADRLADRLLAESPTDLHVLYQKGANFFQAKEFNKALETFDAILRLDERNADAWRAKGICLAEQKLYADALPAYRTALACAPGDPFTLTELGKSLAQLGKHDEAVKVFGEAAIAQPRFAAPLHYLAVSLERVGRLDDALATFDQAVTVDPDRADAWCDRGTYFARQAERCMSEEKPRASLSLLYEALRSYECALAIDPGHALAAEGHASIHGLLGPKLTADRPSPPSYAPRGRPREET